MGEESRLTAYHEAGHMVVAWDLGLNVLGATVIPDPANICHMAIFLKQGGPTYMPVAMFIG
jgi:ATP-dependent Zn protease